MSRDTVVFIFALAGPLPGFAVGGMTASWRQPGGAARAETPGVVA